MIIFIFQKRKRIGEYSERLTFRWHCGPSGGIGAFMEHEELPQDIADTLGLTDAQSTTANPMFFGIYPLYSIAVTQRDAISIKGTRHRLELKPTWIFNMLDGIQLGIQGQFDDTLCVALKCATLQC